MGAEANGNNRWEWEGNENKTRLNSELKMGMGMNHWEWEEMGLKKTFPLISSLEKEMIVCLLTTNPAEPQSRSLYHVFFVT